VDYMEDMPLNLSYFFLLSFTGTTTISTAYGDDGSSSSYETT